MYRYYFRRGFRAFITLGKIFVIIVLIVHLLPVFTHVYFFVQHILSYAAGLVTQFSSVLSSIM